MIAKWNLSHRKSREESVKAVNMLACWRARPVFPHGNRDHFRLGLCYRAEEQAVSPTERKSKKKVVVVGSGWAGLGSAHHLCKQVFLNSFFDFLLIFKWALNFVLEFGFRDLMLLFLKVVMNLDGKLSLLALMMLVFVVINDCFLIMLIHFVRNYEFFIVFVLVKKCEVGICLLHYVSIRIFRGNLIVNL